MTDWLAGAASGVVIGGAVVGCAQWAWKVRGRSHLRAEIEVLLAGKTRPNDDSQTVTQLAAHFGASEDEIVKTLRGSKTARPWGGQLGNERRYRHIQNSN